MKEVDVSSLEHTSWRCQYHVVFAPKYRRMEIYGKIKEDIGIILRKLSAHLWDLELAVEHENSKQDWTDEVIKLIHVKCPLKVVISYNYCDERETTDWEKLAFIAHWMQEVKAFVKGNDEEYLLIFGNCFNSKTRADYDIFDYRGYLYNRQTQRFDRI